MLDQITEPILSPLRRIVPRIGMIDITPLVAIILLQVLAQAVTQASSRLGRTTLPWRLAQAERLLDPLEDLEASGSVSQHL